MQSVSTTRRTRWYLRCFLALVLSCLAWSWWAVLSAAIERMDHTRFLIFVGWGLASALVWGTVAFGAFERWREHRDRRSKRELLRDGALLITSLGSVVAVLGVLFGESGTTPRAIALAAALGTFLGAGLVSLGLRRSENKGEAP